MIDTRQEPPITLADACQYFPSTSGVAHVRTLYRYATAGLRGITLETVFVGGRRCTSREAIQRFVEAVTVARDGGQAPPRRQTSGRQLAAARRELATVHGIT